MFDVHDLVGWVPVDAVVCDGQPGLSWMDVRRQSFSEPFFQQTVERLRSKEPKRQEKFTGFDAALQLEKITDYVSPAGFIFHSSRCGSTLLSNIFKCCNGAVVVSEANAIDKLVARFITDPGRETIYSVILRAVVSAFGQKHQGNEQGLFIKWSCCSTAQVQRIKRIWPDVPSVFLYRDPIETVTSNMLTKPGWLLDQDRRVLSSVSRVPVDEVLKMDDEELCVRSIASFYSSAQWLAIEGCLLLNYEELSPSTLIDVLDFFSITPTQDEREEIERVSKLYSKDVRQSETFQPDVDCKQKLASQRVIDLVNEFANDSYQLLEEKRKRSNH